jgi:hypothetical protein
VECQKQVDDIYCTKFHEEYGLLLFRIDSYTIASEMYNEFKKRGRKGFHMFLNERLEFKDFCEQFYDDLREMYNICSAGMEEEFQRMKSNGWSLDDYATHLKKQQRRRR